MKSGTKYLIAGWIMLVFAILFALLNLVNIILAMSGFYSLYMNGEFASRIYATPQVSTLTVSALMLVVQTTCAIGSMKYGRLLNSAVKKK